MTHSRALAAALLLVASALAGCADDAPSKERIDPGSTSGTTPQAPLAQQPSPVSEFRPRGTSDRWHFHDYWKGNPTITLVEANLTFNATPFGADGVPALSAIFELPHGVIVPPETGYLTFNLSWVSEVEGGLVNITYKPADSNDFFQAGETGRGMPLSVNTTESNCDVPHRQVSAWKFNLTAKPGGTPPVMPPVDFKLQITATIGRPLFIDPPHLNWWRDGEIIPLVAAAEGQIRTAATPAGNVTLPGSLPSPGAPPPNAASLSESYRIPVDPGRIVPEGAKSVVVMLNWTSTTPGGKLLVRFRENNYPSEGPMELLVDGEGSRIFVLKTAQAQTDTTYSNRTTWEFRVLPEGGPAAAFEGTFTLSAWAARLEPAATVAQLTAPS